MIFMCFVSNSIDVSPGSSWKIVNTEYRLQPNGRQANDDPVYRGIYWSQWVNWQIFCPRHHFIGDFSIQIQTPGNLTLLSPRCCWSDRYRIFCTRHESCNAVVYARICRDIITNPRPISHRIWITMEISIVKDTPEQRVTSFVIMGNVECVLWQSTPWSPLLRHYLILQSIIVSHYPLSDRQSNSYITMARAIVNSHSVTRSCVLSLAILYIVVCLME